MNVPLFFILFSAVVIACLWIGKRASSNLKDNEDYFLGGRKIGLFALAMTIFATQMGGGVVMGASEEAFARGWWVLFYPLGMVLGLLLLGLGVGAKFRSLQLSTVAQIFEKVYGSPPLRRFASLLSIVSMFFLLIGQGIAARKFFGALGFDGGLLFSIFWLTLVAYTVVGGLRAVVNTDVLQGGLILVVFALVLGYALFGRPLPFETVAVVSPSNVEAIPWLTWLLLPLFFMVIGQDMGQRCFAAKAPRTVSVASLIASFLLLLASLCPIYFGVMAAKLHIAVPSGASVLIVAAQAITGPTCATFLILAILMAIISTADSLLCSISSNLSSDFTPLSGSVRLSQVITFLVGALTLALSFFFNNVIAIIIFSYELSVSLLFVPVIMAIVREKAPQRAALFAIIAGGIGFLFFRSLPYKELLTLALSGAGYFVGERVARLAEGKIEG